MSFTLLFRLVRASQIRAKCFFRFLTTTMQSWLKEEKKNVSGCPFTSKRTFTKELFKPDEVVYYHISLVSLYRVRGHDNSYCHSFIPSPLLKFFKNYTDILWDQFLTF